MLKWMVWKFGLETSTSLQFPLGNSRCSVVQKDRLWTHQINELPTLVLYASSTNCSQLCFWNAFSLERPSETEDGSLPSPSGYCPIHALPINQPSFLNWKLLFWQWPRNKGSIPCCRVEQGRNRVKVTLQSSCTVCVELGLSILINITHYACVIATSIHSTMTLKRLWYGFSFHGVFPSIVAATQATFHKCSALVPEFHTNMAFQHHQTVPLSNGLPEANEG